MGIDTRFLYILSCLADHLFDLIYFFSKQVTYAFHFFFFFFAFIKHLLVLNFEYCKIFIQTGRNILLICSHKWMTDLI